MSEQIIGFMFELKNTSPGIENVVNALKELKIEYRFDENGVLIILPNENFKRPDKQLSPMELQVAKMVEEYLATYKTKWLTDDGYDFDAIEKSVLSGEGGFGNPHRKWTAHEQFLLWKKMIQSGRFRSRDEYCNILVTYSSYQQALQHLGFEHQ
jgi:hypothetical protein